ncbi:MAG: arsenite S-adenosylmethyltransferase, partial [Nitrososphaerota archaeon]|nr:arsenite S-adenosylmethyltransferase [Nitrososphaerota archaeon]
MPELEIRKAVKDRYQKMALSSDSNCCGNADCCDSSSVSVVQEIPVEASSVDAGCGSPLALINPKEGDVVLDLGSGGGIDVF